jgi:hypothetical protein
MATVSLHAASGYNHYGMSFPGIAGPFFETVQPTSLLKRFIITEEVASWWPMCAARLRLRRMGPHCAWTRTLFRRASDRTGPVNQEHLTGAASRFRATRHPNYAPVGLGQNLPTARIDEETTWPHAGKTPHHSAASSANGTICTPQILKYCLQWLVARVTMHLPALQRC